VVAQSSSEIPEGLMNNPVLCNATNNILCSTDWKQTTLTVCTSCHNVSVIVSEPAVPVLLSQNSSTPDKPIDSPYIPQTVYCTHFVLCV